MSTAEAPEAVGLDPGAHIADPAPLGLSAFALTTFVLSVVNAGLVPEKAEAAVFGLALAYGGIVQVCAGMWEFRKGNTFGATAFASYGAFWISFWWLTGHSGLDSIKPASTVDTAVGIYLLGWTIFTAIMFVGSTRVSGALTAVFAVLTLTFLALTIAKLAGATGIGQLGGWLGIVTALLAWYTAAAGMLASVFKKPVLPTMPR